MNLSSYDLRLNGKFNIDKKFRVTNTISVRVSLVFSDFLFELKIAVEFEVMKKANLNRTVEI